MDPSDFVRPSAAPTGREKTCQHHGTPLKTRLRARNAASFVPYPAGRKEDYCEDCEQEGSSRHAR